MKSDIDLIKENQSKMTEYEKFYKDFDISGIASVLRDVISNFKEVLCDQGVIENISKTVQQFAKTMLTSKDIQNMMSTMSVSAINHMGKQINQTIMSTESIQNMISTLNLFVSNAIQEEIRNFYKYDFSKFFSNLDINILIS